MKANARRTHFIQAICYSHPPPLRLGWGGGAQGVGVEPSRGWEAVPAAHLQVVTVTESQRGHQASHPTFAWLTSPRIPAATKVP